MTKFFITHSWKDIEFARRLFNDLTARGLEGWLDDKTLQGGHRLAEEINKGLEWCDVYIPILSRAALESPWCWEEINAAITLANRRERRGRPRIIPVLIEECEVPPLLAARLYFNFANRYEDALNELLSKGFEISPESPTSVTITPDNANRIVELVRWGKGIANRVAWSPDGRKFAIASSIGIYLYDAQTRVEIRFIETKAWVSGVIFAPDSRLVASWSHDQTIKLWDVVDGREVRITARHLEWVQNVTSIPNVRIVQSEGQTILWDVANGREVLTLDGYTEPVRGVAFSVDGQMLAICLEDKIKLWDVVTGKELRTLRHKASVRCIAFRPDGKILVIGVKDNTIRLWDVVSEEEVRISLYGGMARSLTFTPSGKILAAGTKDNIIKLWEVATGNEVWTLRHTGSVQNVAFALDGNTLAAGSSDNIIKFWDVTTGNELWTLKPKSMARSIAFAIYSGILALGLYDGAIELWDMASEREVQTLSGHMAPVTCVAFAPDGRMLASGSEDGTVRLWGVR